MLLKDFVSAWFCPPRGFAFHISKAQPRRLLSASGLLASSGSAQQRLDPGGHQLQVPFSGESRLGADGWIRKNKEPLKRGGRGE